LAAGFSFRSPNSAFRPNRLARIVMLGSVVPAPASIVKPPPSSQLPSTSTPSIGPSSSPSMRQEVWPGAPTIVFPRMTRT
jgi:hypothetical protein